MKAAVVKETAPGERRVALVPEAVARLRPAGIDVLVESGAGDGAWLTDAARLLSTEPESLAIELIESMLHSGAIVEDDQRIRAATDYARTEPSAMRVPFPKDWS